MKAALDGKTMRNAIDEAGQQTHILGARGHQARPATPSRWSTRRRR